MADQDQLREWLEFYAEFYRYSLPGVATSARAALRGEPAPEWTRKDKASALQAEHALGGVDGFLCDLFGSDWHKDIKRADVVAAMRKHLGI